MRLSWPTLCISAYETISAKKENNTCDCQGKLLDCCVFRAGRNRIIVCSEWRFGETLGLKGNCSYGDIECFKSGKSDRTYDTRFTNSAIFIEPFGSIFFAIYFIFNN